MTHTRDLTAVLNAIKRVAPTCFILAGGSLSELGRIHARSAFIAPEAMEPLWWAAQHELHVHLQHTQLSALTKEQQDHVFEIWLGKPRA